MELSELFQSPTMRKISNSTLTFRQLIESLRNNAKHKNDTIEPSPPQQQENQFKEDSTLVDSQPKLSSQNNNFLLHNESDTGLKAIPKLSVGDRDKLKKNPFPLDVNPQLQSSPSKFIKKTKLEISIQLPFQSSSEISNPFQPSKEILNHPSPQVNASTQYELDSFPQINISYVHSPRDDCKSGQIVRQALKREISIKIKEDSRKKIRDISQQTVQQYIQRQTKITQKSDPSEIFNFFSNLCLTCDIIIKNPSIKKFKNCIYFGHPIERQCTYEGFLLFYDGKIYFGEFLNGFKHGLGVELNLNDKSKMKGEFRDGRKTGKFYVEKQNQKYIGFMENGSYHGQGRLTTQDYVYQGLFEKGQKNGYGQEFYSKTGVRITGTFKNGVLQKSKTSKSIPEIRSKSKLLVSKEKEKSRLDTIKRKSLDRHNQRMNRIRERSQKDSEYEIQFDPHEDYCDPQPPKLQLNTSKLEMYRQPLLQKLPKICQQFDYCSQTPENFESLNRFGPVFNNQEPKFQIPRINRQLGHHIQRFGTSQLEEPLPTPCLTVLKGRR